MTPAASAFAARCVTLTTRQLCAATRAVQLSIVAPDAEVIIVGAGPAGAATAWGLARNGIDVLLLDRAHFPRDKICAEYLSPQASRILSEMGALAPVEAAGAAHLTGMFVRAPGGAEIRGAFAAAHGYHGFRDRGLALPRRTLDAILLDRARAAGARVAEGVRVSDMLRSGNGRVTGVRVAIDDPTQPTRDLHAAITVGADGLRSVVARRLALTRSAWWPRRVAFVAHYRGVAGMDSMGEMHVDRAGYIGLADVGNGQTNVALVVPAHRAKETVRDFSAPFGAQRERPRQDRDSTIETWVASRPHLAPRFENAERISPVRATGPFAQSSARAWTPGAALVGDAANFIDPFTGEGIYTALRGGEILAPYIYEALRGRAANASRRADVALAAYDRSRRYEFRAKWAVERLVAAAVAWPALMDRVARSLERRRDMADLFVGVAGDFVPPTQLLRPAYLWRLVAG
jgi:menaquinone-9 beta-reductase